MMNLKSSIISIALMATTALHAEIKSADFHIIPLPKSIESNKGKPFLMTKTVTISCPADTFTANQLSRDIKNACGMDLKTIDSKGDISLIIDPKIEHPEGYLLLCNDKGIKIKASTKAGLFYGAKTLSKAIYQHNADTISIPASTVSDAPRFAYRGMLLDCGRHFFPVKDIKTFLDMLALHNMNTFHWHLTEDQGWRFEVKKYPVLTDKGSVRRGTEIGWSVGLNDSIPHGGYYTQDDCREIVKYAADRNITVIPEIDIPGHTSSFLACFPETGCTGGPYNVSDHWGVHEDIVCAGNELTYKILFDVLDEVCDVFPSEYINIGGDEALKTRWEKCPKCQAKIKEEGIVATDTVTAEHALQGWFSQRIQKYLASKGRKAIGWNEIAENGAGPESAIMNRYGSDATKAAVKEGRKVVVNTTASCYFDYPQRSDLRLEPKLFPLGFPIGISSVYSLEPEPAGISADEKKYIMGVQANVWGEFIDRMLLVQYQSLPRMAAICEVGWTSPEKKDYKDFLRRLKQMRRSYNANGYFHCNHIE